MITGSVQSKNNKLYMVINLRDEFGRRKPKWIATGLDVRGNKRRAEQMLRDELRKYEGIDASRSVEFTEYCEQWLAQKKISIEENTYVAYRNQVQRIIDYFRPMHVLLVDLKPVQIREFYLYLATEGNLKTGKPLAARSIKDIAQRMRSILGDAVIMELIRRNPAQRIKPPKPLDHDQRQDDDDVYMDPDDLQIFFRAAKDEPLHDLFLATVFCGFRREEVGGLNWRRIDFEARALTVLETRVRADKKEYTKSRTKNSASYRVYPMGDFLYNLFGRVKERQDEYRRLFGSEYVQNNGEVFTWPDGRPFRLDYITQRFKDIVRKTPELDDRLHFHSLRASCISNLFAGGYGLKEVQKWVGQEDVETTLKIYNKFKQKEKSRISQGLDNAFQQIAPFGNALEKC